MPPKMSTPRWPSSRIARAARPELLAKTSISPRPFMPTAAACRAASNTLTVRSLMWGQQWTWESTAPSSRSMLAMGGMFTIQDLLGGRRLNICTCCPCCRMPRPCATRWMDWATMPRSGRVRLARFPWIVTSRNTVSSTRRGDICRQRHDSDAIGVPTPRSGARQCLRPSTSVSPNRPADCIPRESGEGGKLERSERVPRRGEAIADLEVLEVDARLVRVRRDPWTSRAAAPLLRAR